MTLMEVAIRMEVKVEAIDLIPMTIHLGQASRIRISSPAIQAIGMKESQTATVPWHPRRWM